MPNRKVFKSDLPPHVTVVPFEENAALEDHVYIGEYHHTVGQDNLGYPENHVMYHHVRELLYKSGVNNQMDYPINMVETSAETLEPGPMDFSTDEPRLTSYSVEYTMAYPTCILMVTGRKAMSGGIANLRASHGGEPLRLAHYAQANDWVCWTAIFVGEGLTLEKASLVIEADEPMTPLIGRIIDKEFPVTNEEYVQRTDNSSIYALRFEALPEQKYTRFLVGHRGFKDFVRTSGTPMDLLTYTRLLGGTPQTATATTTSAVWSYDSTSRTATYTGGNDGANEYITLTYPNGATDTSAFNAIRFRTSLTGSASLVVQFMSANGASRTHTIMGPVDESREIILESSASGAYYHSIRIACNEDCVLDDIIIKSDSLTLTAIMLASPDVVDMQAVGGNVNFNFNAMGFASTIGMSYQEDK